MIVIDCPECGRTKLAGEVHSCCLDFTPEVSRQMYDALVFAQKFNRMMVSKGKDRWPRQLAEAVDKALAEAVHW